VALILQIFTDSCLITGGENIGSAETKCSSVSLSAFLFLMTTELSPCVQSECTCCVMCDSATRYAETGNRQGRFGARWIRVLLFQAPCRTFSPTSGVTAAHVPPTHNSAMLTRALGLNGWAPTGRRSVQFSSIRWYVC